MARRPHGREPSRRWRSHGRAAASVGRRSLAGRRLLAIDRLGSTRHDITLLGQQGDSGAVPQLPSGRHGTHGHALRGQDADHDARRLLHQHRLDLIDEALGDDDAAYGRALLARLLAHVGDDVPVAAQTAADGGSRASTAAFRERLLR